MPSEEEIIVTGTRVRHYYIPADNGGAEPTLANDSPSLEPIEESEGSHPDAGYHVYELIDLGLKLKMPEGEWNKLTQAQKDALFFVLENYQRSPDLTAALQHLKNEGINSVEIRFGPQGTHYDGTSYEFGNNQWGQPAAAAISYNSVGLARTDIVAGSNVVISFNSLHAVGQSGDWFGRNLIHELLHPFVADTPRSNGAPDDHDRLEPMTTEAWNQIVPGGTLTGS